MIGDDVNCNGLGGGNILRNGNIKVEENTTTTAFGVDQNIVDQNTVGGNLQVFKNRGLGPKSVQGNVVADTVACFHNDPPFVGDPNVAPNREGQCF